MCILVLHPFNELLRTNQAAFSIIPLQAYAFTGLIAEPTYGSCIDWHVEEFLVNSCKAMIAKVTAVSYLQQPSAGRHSIQFVAGFW